MYSQNTEAAYPRLLIAAPRSGSGKTLLTCALLRLLSRQGLHLQAFKCGPDYIDPMFHRKVLGIPSVNLDTWFTGREGTVQLFARHMQESAADLGIIEGVMGLYDGLGGLTGEASSYDLACALQAPVLLIIDAGGMGRSMIAEIKGFQLMDTQHRIAGVILNRTSASFARMMKPEIERECGIPVVGSFPKRDDLHLDSRYLGLKLPGEIASLQENVDRAADLLEENLDLQQLLTIAGAAGSARNEKHTKRSEQEIGQGEKTAAGPIRQAEAEGPLLCHQVKQSTESSQDDAGKVRIAVAMDEAFCFYYEDNLRLLQNLGAELVYFSPLHDSALPERISGLYLGGGYPELRARELSANHSMLQSIRQALRSGLPSLAECGGFMYLHETLQTQDGTTYPLVGAVPGTSHYIGRLVRFGYCSLQEHHPCFLPAGEEIRGHEFHYYDSDNNGAACTATKPFGHRTWPCIHETAHSFWGYPHLYWPSAPAFAEHFIACCASRTF